ncbi:GGDEF domain-containing protein [Rhizomonospora bruguierae]|uniref:GGDEF domain-containing protein n=1 Tax=Rhizomonospora bruguierae TaxID=1581705 RepID=UPI001BCE22DC|nr:GGDEF domain-containing protein [Micromonospora sp. NBRC 107566]
MTTGSVADRWRSTTTLRLANLLDLAEEARLRGDYRTGSNLAREGAALAAEAGDGAGRARALRSLATQLLRLGEHEAAVTACSDALALLETAGDELGMCETLTAQAMPYNDLGLHEEALEALGRAHQIAQRLNNRTLLYWVHNRTGVVHASMGRHAVSTEYFVRALTMVEGLDDDARFCILNNIADNAVYRVPELRADGDEAGAARVLKEALGYIEEALSLARAAAHPFQESLAVDNLGMLRALQGEYDAAIGLIEESRTIAVARGYRSLESAALQHLAQVRLMRGDCRAGIEGLTIALDRALTMGEKPLAMVIHRELSEAYERIGDYPAALRHYRRYHRLERAAHNDVAATRARMMMHTFELDNARLEADNARLEMELHRIRSLELEADKEVLERRAVDLSRRVHEDPLTGLANRRVVDVRLPELTTAATNAGRPLCLAIADVDLFKGVNDRFGHLLGDDVLRQIATVLRGGVHGEDLVARLGGEEFLLAFQGADLTEAYRRCERLRVGVAEYPWRLLHPGLAVTISIGVAEHDPELDHKALMARADKQLYQAKRGGRNRVEAG